MQQGFINQESTQQVGIARFVNTPIIPWAVWTANEFSKKLCI